jgi:TP901 family phage tail tape measure protein
MAVQINVQASQTALAQSISQGVAAYNARFASQNQLNLQVNPRSFSQPLGRITSDLADFESALKASNARVLAFGASTAVLGGSVKVFKEIANITIEIEKSLTDVNRVLGLSTSGLQKFSTELFSISKQTASSFDDATKAALEFSRQGLNTQETLKRTADALTLVRLTGISSRQAVEDLTSTINGFSKAGLTTSQVVNKLAAVEQDFAVSASDLTEALSRTGQAAQEAGVGFDELNALVTTAQQSTARGGAVIGNALKTIFTRLQRTDTLDQLENFNISVRDIEGNILPATQILKNFADQYKNLADSQRAQLSEQVAGVYQVNILKGIIGDLSNSQGTYTKALERGTMASNEADIANQKLNKTLSALSTQTGLGLQQLANNVGKVTFAPIFEAIVSPINDAVTYINETLEGEGPGSIFANGLLKGIRNVITGPGLAVAFAVIAKVAKNTFEDATKALPAILGITTEAQRRANIEKSILAILQTQSTLSLALQGQQGNATAQAATVLNYAKLQTAQYQQQLQIAQQLAPLLAAQNVTIGARGVQVGAKIKAGGHIPAFAEMSERMGAAMGGYKSGKVVKAPSSVGANTYMNTAEEAKYVPGFAQPFINPPAGSKAGRAHRQNAISRTGVDPYTAGGFIPNFAKKSIRSLGQQSLNNLYDVGDRVGNTTIYDKYDDQGLIKTFNLPFTYEQYRSKAADAYDNALKIYQEQKDKKIGLAKANEYLKKVTGGYSQALEKKYFDEPDISPAKKHLNKIAGGFGEKDTAEIFNKHTKLINAVGPDFKKIIKNRVSFIETKVRKNDVPDEVLLEKFLRGYAKTSLPVSFKGNRNEDVISAKFGTLIHAIAAKTPDTKSLGFIPNFAPPTSAIRVPWFKKFGNASFDAVQPTLGISKANDTDTFRSSQFRSKAFEKAATDGDPNLFAPLYEDFVFKALQLTSQSKIKDQLIRGYVNQPGTDQKQSAFDAFLGDVAFEKKGFPKGNLTGSISKNLNDKFERYVKANPAGAAKIKEAIMIFNEVGHENQIPSEFGKNFTQLAGTSYSQMLKNSPDLVKGLSTETNSLLNNYVKNPAFLAMNAAKGFLPNFASMISSSIKGKGNISAIKTGKNDYEIEGVEVGKKFRGQGLGSQLYGNIAQKIGSGSTIKSVLLPQEQALADYASGKSIPAKAIFPQLSWAKMAKSSKLLINGKEIAMSDFESGIAGHKYNAAKLDMALIELVNSHASGFIPNFAYKQAVMGLEESMSGNKAVLDTKSGPFPFIRNTSQSNFASAISDHGGLKNALSDSMRNQEAAGLMNKGYVPNFATINAQTAIGASFGSLKTQEQKEFVELNKALSQLARNTKLTTQQQQQYINTVMNNAASLAASTKSTTIVSEASKALATSLQQNQNAQKKAAAQTQAQKQTQAAAPAAATVKSGFFEKLSNNVAFTLGVPMLAGQVESAIQRNRDRSEMTYGERFASTGVSAGLTGATTGAAIGSVLMPGLGSAIGAGVGAIVGLTGAAISARTSLDDLSKSIESVITKNKNDIESVKTIAVLENQLASEKDPLNIEILKMKIIEAAESIKDTDFAEKILKSSKSIADFDKSIKNFVIKKRGVENLSKVPDMVAAFGKKTKTGEGAFSEAFSYNIDVLTLSSKDYVKKYNEVKAEMINSFKPFANELIRLEKAASETNPKLKPVVDDIIKNLYKYKESGELSEKLQPLVDAEIIDEQYTKELIKVIDVGSKYGNRYFRQYLENFKSFFDNAKTNLQEISSKSGGRVEDQSSIKEVFARINISIQNALTDYAIQLSNIDFAANIGKLNLEKTGSIFETAASAIGKNLQDIAKNQLDFLVSQMDTLRQNNLLDIQATQFKQSRGMQQKTFLTERKSRISAFLEPNIINEGDSRGEAEKALDQIGENLNYDFEKLKKLSLNFSEGIQRNLEALIEKEKREQKTFSNERRNAETLFNLDQEYAKKSIELKDKTAELDFKLQKTIYANLLKEKQVIESFNFANQDLQIRSQAQIERMSIPMNANPNFFAGATRFEQEDYKFKLDQEKERKQLAVSLRSASNESLLANFRNKIIDSNTLATNENTKAIRDLTIEMLEARLKNLPKAKPTQQISASQSISSVNEDYNTPYVLQDKYFAKPDKNQYKNEIISTIFDDLDSPAIKEYSDKANANAIKMYKRQSYMPNAENPVQFSYDSNLSRDLYGEKKPEAQIEQERIEPLSFFRQLYNVNTGNEKANQLPVEQRPYSQVAAEYQKKREEASLLKLYELQTPDSEPYKGLTYTPTKTTKNFVESIPETSVEAPSTQIETSQQRQAAETAETNVQLQSQIDLLKGVGRQNAIIKSDVADVSPYTSVIKSLEEEKVLFAKNLDLLEQRKQSLTEQKSIADTDKNAEKSVQLNNQLLDVQGQINTGQLQRLKVEQSIESSQKAQKAYMDYMASRGKFMTGVKKATGQMREEIDMFGETLGGTITTSFRDGLVGAMNAAANETDNLESALMNVASNFLKAIQNAMFTQAANQITTSLFPTGSAPSVSGDQKGGFIRAQNGMYISGGRTGDKNPAMLEDGEYVLNRNAVRGMGGPSAVDKLNFETYPRFGGKQKGGKITGFAVGGDPGSMSASVNLARPFADLSGFGREQSPEFQAYVDEAREAQAKKDKKKAERKALVNSLIATAVTTGVMMGISSGAKGFKSKTPLNKVAGSKPNFFQRMDLKKAGVAIGADGLPIMQTGGAVGFNQGGFLPYGSRLTDTIPAYLSGGEYVVNSKAVRKYGVGGLNRINSGVARFAEGGMVGDNQSESNNTSNSTANNISINITVNANGNGMNKEEKDNKGEGTEGPVNDFSNRIKAVVLEVISTEQRTGGLLDSTKKK